MFDIHTPLVLEEENFRAPKIFLPRTSNGAYSLTLTQFGYVVRLFSSGGRCAHAVVALFLVHGLQDEDHRADRLDGRRHERR